MQMRCPQCDVYFHLEPKPSIKFASAVGAVTGAVITRRVRGVGLGALVGWGLGKLMHRGTTCPRCADKVAANAHVVDLDATNAPSDAPDPMEA